MKKWFIYSLAICLFIPAAANAQISNTVSVGARPIGLGGAFTAVANDGNAIFWNPAGIVTLQRQEITTMYSSLYQSLGLNNSYLGYVMPIGDNHAFGVDWLHIGQDDAELGYSRDSFNLAYSLRLPSIAGWNMSVGSKLKFVNTDISLDGTSFGQGSGYGFDFGIIVNPVENLRFAVVGQDMGGTSVTYDNDTSEEILSQQFRFGASYTPFEGFLIAADIDDRVHVGAEYWLMNIIALRGGFQQDIDKIDNYSASIYSAGFSARYRFLQFDYAVEDHPDLDITHRFGVSFFYNPSLVSIKDALIKPVPLFRSLYRKYSNEDFAEVVLKNSSQQPLTVRVTIDIPTVTQQPYEEEIILEPASTHAYQIGISLSNEILSARGSSYDNLVQPVLTISYEQDRSTKVVTRNLAPLYVLGKNKISWSAPERVASFVTPEDVAVDRFARSVIQSYNTLLVEKYNNSNLGKATVLFDALGKHGIVYQADQQTPWYLIAADSSIFDNIQYPTEMLNSKIGDCDDCTVLFASLLENLSIETVLLDVDAPGAGHIYMMFDSGISPDDIDRQPYNTTDYVEYNGKIWFPVETTMYGHTFSAAWRNGAEEYHRRKAQGYVHEINMAEAMQIYQAGQPPAQEVTVPDRALIDELVMIDVETYDTRIREFATAGSVSLDDPDAVYDAGAAYLRFNRLEDAVNMFQRAIQLNPDMGDAANGLGVIHTMRGEYNEALQRYNEAAQLMPNNAGVRLNIAITLYLLGRLTEAGTEYQRAIDIDKTLLDLLKFLRPGG